MRYFVSVNLGGMILRTAALAFLALIMLGITEQWIRSGDQKFIAAAMFAGLLIFLAYRSGINAWRLIIALWHANFGK